MRVVALVPGGVGDQILFFPTLDSLKQNYPEAEIDVVVEPRSKPAYRVSKSVSDVIAFDYEDRNSPADWANLLGVLRDRDYSAAITTRSTWGIGLLLWLTGIPTRIGYAGAGGNGFLTEAIPAKPEQYKPHSYYDLLQGLGISAACPELAISIPKSDLDWAEAEQKRLGVKNYVLIHDGSSEVSRNRGTDRLYSVGSWQKIIQDFQQRQPDLPLVVVQTPDDQQLTADLVKVCPNLKVTRLGDVGKLAAMIAAANLVLCTDGAPLYLAIALQVYTVALFGPTDPENLMPKSDKFQSIRSSTGKTTDIAPEQVLAKVWGN